MSNFDYSDPIITRRRKGDLSDPFVNFNEPLTIDTSNYNVILTEIPDRLSRVQVSGQSVTWAEIQEGVPTANQYFVDYVGRTVTFHSSRAGLQLSFQYMGSGLHFIPSSSVYTQQSGGNVTQTLKNLTDGASQFVFQFDYNNVTIYKQYNIVNYAGASYMYINTTSASGNLPTNSAYWARISGSIFKGTYSTSTSYSSGDVVTDSNNYKLLQSLISNNTNQPLTDSTKWQILIDVSGIVNTLNTTNTNVTNAESARVTAESGRTSAESGRVSAESSRASAESSRSSAETTRAGNESTRQSNETTRISQESTRQSGYNDFKLLEAYNNTHSYVPMNKVTQSGSTYQCILATVGNAPPNPTYWILIAAAGSVASVTSSNADIAVANPTTTPTLTLNTGVGPSQISKRDINGNLQNIGYAVINVSANTTLTLAQSGIINVTTGATPVTITLPDATTAQTVFTIKKADSGVGQVIINTTSSQTIDGVTSKTLINQYAVITVVSSGGNWLVDVPNTSDAIGLLPNLTTNSKTDLATAINENNQNKITTKSANATLTLAERGIINVTTGASNLTMTLPSAATPQVRYQIKKVDNGAGTVTVATTSSQLIDGVSTKTLTNQYSSIELVSDGTGWTVAGDNFGDNLYSQNATSVTLSNGVQVINIVRKSRLKNMKITGRTLINLLGRDGNCESVNPFAVYQTTRALDATNFVYGTNGLKVTLNGFTNGNSAIPFTFRAGKYYIALAHVKNGNASSGVALSHNLMSVYGTLVTDTTKFTLVWNRLSVGASDVSGHAEIAISGASGQFAYADGLRIYEITVAEYNALPGMTADQIAAKYPYVDDMKHVNGVYVQNPGKNLIPTFIDWSTANYSTMTVQGAYSAAFTAGAVGTFYSAESPNIPVVVGQTYRYTADLIFSNVVGTGFFLEIYGYDSNYNFVSGSNTGSVSTKINGTLGFSYTVPANVAYIRTRITSINDTSGTITVNNPRLNVGAVDLGFEPQAPSCLYMPDPQARSNVDGSVADQLYMDGEGKPRIIRRFKEMVLDGSYSWAYNQDKGNTKEVYITIGPANSIANDGLGGIGQLIKYDGKVLTRSGSPTNDQFSLYNPGANAYINVQDIDTGWDNVYRPDPAEAQAYFNGWKATGNTAGTVISSEASGSLAANAIYTVVNGTNGKYISASVTKSADNVTYTAATEGADFTYGYDVNGKLQLTNKTAGALYFKINYTYGVATTTWSSVVDGSVAPTQTLAYVSANQTAKYTPYRLTYQLSQSVDEAVTSEGELFLHDGANQIEVGTGVVVREPANPNGDATYIMINDSAFPSSKLSMRTNKILSVYSKNGQADKSWTIDGTNANGKQRAWKFKTNFDQSASYSVTYLALDTYLLGIAPLSITGEYAPNIKENVDSLSRSIVETKTALSVLQNTKAQKQQPQWIAPTLLNAWVNYGSGFQTAAYLLDELGFVHLRGLVKNGTTGASTPIIILPKGYRPATKLLVGVMTYSGTAITPGQLEIETDGRVYLVGGGVSYVTLENIFFRAEQ